MSNIDKYEARKKMVYDFMCDDMYVPMKIKELCIVLGVKKEDRPQLEQILLDLQAEGRITLSKRGKYSKSEIKKTVGVFTAHQRGFGFVTVEGEPEYYEAEYGTFAESDEPITRLPQDGKSGIPFELC